MSDFVQRALTLPVIPNLIATGAAVAGVWFKFYVPEDGKIVGTLLSANAGLMNAAVPIAKSIIGDSIAGMPVDYNRPIPTTVAGWQKEYKDFGQTIENKIKGIPAGYAKVSDDQRGFQGISG